MSFTTIITSNTLSLGGAERQRVALANALAASGHQVRLVLLQEAGPLREFVDPGVEVIFQPWFRPRLPRGPLMLVTGTTNTEAGWGRLATGAGLRSGRRRWLVAAHNPPVQTGPTFSPGLAYLMRGADGFIALSAGQWSDLTQYQRLHGTVHLVPNGVPVPVDAQPRHMLDGLVRLGFIGRMTCQKGIDVLLAALAGVRRTNWTLDLFGDGPDRAALERSVPAELRARVRFAGWCPDAQIALDQIDVLLVPSRNEAFPMVILEAMAAGVPVIASPVGAIAEMLDEGSCGRLVRSPSVATWQAVLDEILETPDLLNVYPPRALERVRREYSVDAMRDGYLAAFAAAGLT